jgi:hypothetical protein
VGGTDDTIKSVEWREKGLEVLEKGMFCKKILQIYIKHHSFVRHGKTSAVGRK